jgi:hypothetical protein
MLGMILKCSFICVCLQSDLTEDFYSRITTGRQVLEDDLQATVSGPPNIVIFIIKFENSSNIQSNPHVDISAIQYRSTARQLYNSPVTVLQFQLLYSSLQSRSTCLTGSKMEMELFDPVKINRYTYSHIHDLANNVCTFAQTEGKQPERVQD